MSKQKIYYKVVTPELKSICFTWEIFPQSVVQYVLNQFVKTDNGTPLYVFDNLSDVDLFIENNNLRINDYKDKCYVYQCEIKGRCKYIPLFSNWCAIMIYELSITIKKKKSISNFLNKYKFNRMSNQFIPQGTIAVKQVKLLKKVEI